MLAWLFGWENWMHWQAIYVLHLPAPHPVWDYTKLHLMMRPE